MSNVRALSTVGLGKRFIRDEALRSWAVRLGLRAPGHDQCFWALKDVTLNVARGEGLGILGKNGAGKSTLLKIISRILTPTEGEVRLYGRVNSLLEIGTGFQPDLSGRDNIYLNASILGMSRQEVNEVYDDIVAFSGLKDFMEVPVKRYSSGMYSRLAFSVAAHVRGDILALDEVLSVGDAEFRRKCQARMSDLMGSERTVLFVSHSMDAITRFCTRAIWLDRGRIVADGAPVDVVKEYMRSIVPANASVSVAAMRQPSREQPTVGRERKAPPVGGVAQHVLPRLCNTEVPVADLISVSLVDERQEAKDIFLRSEPVAVRLEYQVTLEGWDLHCVLHVHCAPRRGVPDEVHVFTATSQTGALCAGRYASTVQIPGRLLTTGQYFVSVALVTPSKPIIRHAKLERVLSFRILDDGAGDTYFLPEFLHGVIQPDVRWSTRSMVELESDSQGAA